jgi:hypothetical protein
MRHEHDWIDWTMAVLIVLMLLAAWLLPRDPPEPTISAVSILPARPDTTGQADK